MGLDCLECTLTRKIWHDIGKGGPAGVKYLIGRAETGKTVKGEMQSPVEGERYRLWGEWRTQKPYKGRAAEMAFEFVRHEVVIEESASGVAQYLTNYVPTLGPVKSKALVEAFGADTLTTLRASADMALQVPGITPAIIEAIKKHFEDNPQVDPAAYAKLIDMFSAFRVPRRIINTLIRDFGSNAPQFVTDNPYILLAFPRMGWKTVDSFAIEVAKYDRNGLERHKAAVVEALTVLSGRGHTYGLPADVESEAWKLINTKPRPAAYGAAEAEDLISINDSPDGFVPFYSLSKLACAEQSIAARVAALSIAAEPLPFTLPDEGLLPGQSAALRLIEQHPLVIVTGAPGTGKTYTLARAIKGCVEHGFKNIRVVTPTGKAAKRAAESINHALPGSDVSCSTIHRALEPVPSMEATGVPSSDSKHGRGRGEFGFARNADHPIDAQLIVADEWSMADVSIASDLFQAVARGTRVVLVGDENQLPSVGPGSVLRDLMAAGVPTATLTEIQRNSGRIVRACHAIKDGICPEPAKKLDFEAGDNWIHLELSDPEAIGAKIVELHASTKTFCPLWDMQVISPQYDKPGVGCSPLNAALSDLLNKYKKLVRPGENEEPGRRPEFERGDKVVRTKNGLADLMVPFDRDKSPRPDCRWDDAEWGLAEIDIVNGDMGIIYDVYKDKDNYYVVVEFRNPTRLCRLPYGDSHLSLAYAITCHKAQGSGFPYVIAPVHNSFYFDPKTQTGLWNREMFYTIASRAEKLLVTVGEFSAIRSAVSRKTVHQRKTRLKSLVVSALAPKPAPPTERADSAPWPGEEESPAEPTPDGALSNV